ASACRTRPIVEPATTVPPGLTSDQVKHGILMASSRRHWMARETGEGKIRALIEVRGKHSAETEITYDARTYQIRYVSSEHLMHSESGKIHKGYNGWVIKLDRTIRQELLRAARKDEQ
ncbi:MAG TPA: hypothetical protein VII78_03905, partial [Myxococcota bacterium]